MYLRRNINRDKWSHDNDITNREYTKKNKHLKQSNSNKASYYFLSFLSPFSINLYLFVFFDVPVMQLLSLNQITLNF